MIKKILLILSVLFFSANIFSQVKLSRQEYDKLNSEQATLKNKVDSLYKKLRANEASKKEQDVKFQKLLIDLSDTIKTLKANLLKLELYKAKKKTFEAQLKQKKDSIIILQSTISEKDKQIIREKRNGEAKAREEKEKGKKKALSTVVIMYQESFDELIRSSTKASVVRDMQLIGNNQEAKPVLNDMQIYFNAQELLLEKFDAVKIRNAQMQLNQITRQSKLLNVLKENIEYYKDFNTALKETIGKLVSLDNQKSANGDSEIQKMKFNDIVTILTDYMYNYYDYAKYPYLSDIILEIIKRKQLDADADIRDLMIKL